jgi:hypothetical protein
MSLNDFFQSKTFKGILYGVAIMIILLVVFQLGVFVGFKKATFSGGWTNNYYRNFAGQGPEFMREFEGRDMMGGHGVSGQIVKMEAPNIIIRGFDNMEKIIVTDPGTQIMNMRNQIKINDLKAEDNVIVIGAPDESGQIEAKLIRVMPFPPASFTNPAQNFPGTSQQPMMPTQPNPLRQPTPPAQPLEIPSQSQQ